MSDGERPRRRVPVRWITLAEAVAIAAVLKKAAGDGKVAGDRRLPIAVTTRYVEDGVERSDTSLYHLGYALEEGGLFGGRHVRLRGLSLITHGAKNGQKRLDAMWKPATK